MRGVSLSRAEMQVIANAIKLERSKFDKQFRMIGLFCILFVVTISMIFCDTPIIFRMELKHFKIKK